MGCVWWCFWRPLWVQVLSPIMLQSSAPEGDLEETEVLEPDFLSPGALQAGQAGRPWRGQSLRALAQPSTKLKPEGHRDHKRVWETLSQRQRNLILQEDSFALGGERGLWHPIC